METSSNLQNVILAGKKVTTHWETRLSHLSPFFKIGISLFSFFSKNMLITFAIAVQFTYPLYVNCPFPSARINEASMSVQFSFVQFYIPGIY